MTPAARLPDHLRLLLCDLGRTVLARFIQLRDNAQPGQLSGIHAETPEDTIFNIDHQLECLILDWFSRHWPAEHPVQLVMEGLTTDRPSVFPISKDIAETRCKCIIDPIDGTRNVMYDKKAGWLLTALAPQKGEDTTLADIEIACMTELPTTKQWRADQLSVTRGNEVVAEGIDTFTGIHRPITPTPSQANHLTHQFLSFTKFFPLGKAETVALEDKLWPTLGLDPQTTDSGLFDDQYLSTGGQLYEIISGHDLMIADLRPLIHRRLGQKESLVCHPYDICTYPILEALGGIIHFPDKLPQEIPLDTTTPVSWVMYANSDIARLVHPKLMEVLSCSEE